MTPAGETERVFGNKRELAAFFGVSVPTIDRWLDQGCPVAEGGSNGVPYKFDFGAVSDWRREVDQRESDQESARATQIREMQASLFGADQLPSVGDGPDPISARQKTELIAAEYQRVRLGQARGELMRADLTRLRLAEVFQRLQTRLRGLPDLLARRHGLAADKVEAMEGDVEGALEDAANEIERMLAEMTASENAAAA